MTTPTATTIHEILKACTVMLRKDEEVEKSQVGPLEVTDIYVMHHESSISDDVSDFIKVDVIFMIVAVVKSLAEQYKPDLIKLLDEWPSDLQKGPSYIEVGATIGSQDAALQLFALGKVLELWDIVTPVKLGATGDQIKEMAGAGFIMITGYKGSESLSAAQ